MIICKDTVSCFSLYLLLTSVIDRVNTLVSEVIILHIGL